MQSGDNSAAKVTEDERINTKIASKICSVFFFKKNAFQPRAERKQKSQKQQSPAMKLTVLFIISWLYHQMC